MQESHTFDFLRYCDDYGIEYTTSAGNLSNGWVAALDCPFCIEDGENEYNKHHLGIAPEGMYSNCWRCGGHSIKNLCHKLTPTIPWGKLQATYSDYVDIDYRLNIKKEHVESVPFNFMPLTNSASNYLLSRNFNPDFCATNYGFRDGGFTGDFAFRIVVPVIYNGVVTSYQGRAYNNRLDIKYKFLAENKCVINPKEILYNLDNCKKDYVIVTEGVFDCIRLAGNYCTNVCATMGISTTPEQVNVLANRFKSVYICFDPEKGAYDRAVKLGNSLSSLGVKVNIVDTEKEYDLGDTSWEEASELKREILQGEL